MTQFLKNADGLKIRRIILDDYVKWKASRSRAYDKKHPICRFPLLDEELPAFVVSMSAELVSRNQYLRARKYFKDVSEAQWMAIREFVFQRDQRMCRYCGSAAVAADHVLAFSEFGSSHPLNLVASCMRCNSSKSSISIEQWKGRK